MIAIIGALGSQGKRYQAILSFLRKGYFNVDIGLEERPLKEATGFILATPTATHEQWIRKLIPYNNRPILCEKPVTTSIESMRTLSEELDRDKIPFSMVYQYRHLVENTRRPLLSYYDYFRHGNDGLIWDCLQIIGHANSEVRLKEESPIWHCEINGQKLNLASMDFAYVCEVSQWLRGGAGPSLSEILDIHEKVHAYACKTGSQK